MNQIHLFYKKIPEGKIPMKSRFTLCLITFISLNSYALKFQYSSSQSREIASTNDFQQAAKTLVDFSEKCGLENNIIEFKTCAQTFFQNSLSEKTKSKMSYFLFSNKSSAQLRKCNKKELDNAIILCALIQGKITPRGLSKWTSI